MIADLGRINTRVCRAAGAEDGAERDQDRLDRAGPASYLGGPAAAMIVNKLGENFEQQIAPLVQRAGISPTLTRPLPCSLALPACRRYASLREQLAHKAALRLEEPERESIRHPKKKKTSKKKSRHKHYSEDASNERAYADVRAYRDAPRPAHHEEWRDVRLSRYE
ncbi:MAG: hypothetical protein WDN31_19965 [Hyphomicrobium sp.]